MDVRQFVGYGLSLRQWHEQCELRLQQRKFIPVYVLPQNYRPPVGGDGGLLRIPKQRADAVDNPRRESPAKPRVNPRANPRRESRALPTTADELYGRSICGV